MCTLYYVLNGRREQAVKAHIRIQGEKGYLNKLRRGHEGLLFTLNHKSFRKFKVQVHSIRKAYFFPFYLHGIIILSLFPFAFPPFQGKFIFI